MLRPPPSPAAHAYQASTTPYGALSSAHCLVRLASEHVRVACVPPFCPISLPRELASFTRVSSSARGGRFLGLQACKCLRHLSWPASLAWRARGSSFLWPCTLPGTRMRGECCHTSRCSLPQCHPPAACGTPRILLRQAMRPAPPVQAFPLHKKKKPQGELAATRCVAVPLPRRGRCGRRLPTPPFTDRTRERGNGIFPTRR